MLFREKIPIDIFSTRDRLKKQLYGYRLTVWIDAGGALRRISMRNWHDIKIVFNCITQLDKG